MSFRNFHLRKKRVFITRYGKMNDILITQCESMNDPMKAHQ